MVQNKSFSACCIVNRAYANTSVSATRLCIKGLCHDSNVYLIYNLLNCTGLWSSLVRRVLLLMCRGR